MHLLPPLSRILSIPLPFVINAHPFPFKVGTYSIAFNGYWPIKSFVDKILLISFAFLLRIGQSNVAHMLELRQITCILGYVRYFNFVLSATFD